MRGTIYGNGPQRGTQMKYGWKPLSYIMGTGFPRDKAGVSWC
jgi:hypothetical protein